MTEKTNYAYVFVVRKNENLEIETFADLEVAKKSKDTDCKNFVGWTGNLDEESGHLWCLDCPENEEWFIYKKIIIPCSQCTQTDNSKNEYYYIEYISRIANEIIKLLRVNYPNYKDIKLQQFYDFNNNEYTLTICVNQLYYVSRCFSVYELEKRYSLDNFVNSAVKLMYYDQLDVYLKKQS